MAEILSKVEEKVGNLAKRGIVAEFKEFVNRGNVVDVAVAFVMGAAFKTVVDSFAGAIKALAFWVGLLVPSLVVNSQTSPRRSSR